MIKDTAAVVAATCEFTVRLPVEMHQRLRERARVGDQRMAQVVRVAVREYLERTK